MASHDKSTVVVPARAAAAALLVALGLMTVAACKRDRVAGEFCMRDDDCESKYCRASVCQVPPPVSTITDYPSTGGHGGTAGAAGHGGGGAGGTGATGGTGGTATGGTGGAAGGTAGAGG